MGMQITSIGNGVPYLEFPQDRGTVKTQVQTTEARAVREAIIAALPGGGNRSTVDNVTSTTRDLQKISMAFNKLKYVVDHESNQVTVKVIDPETDKVVKVLPPEELQRLHYKIKEAIGFLFDEQV
ncbi:MAG: flagellar protein FlaG [Spirochaetaceae bacterium]|jgi:flagellar protein FlaG|nr:flagellar protein FlaG [Spirochaetaceae bacterium]